MYGTSARFSTIFLLALVDEAVDLVLEQLVAFAEGHLALQVQDGDVARRIVPRSA